MDSTRGPDDLKRPISNTNANYNEPFETQLESVIFDSSSRFSPEIAGNLNWHPREDYTNATGFSFSTGIAGIPASSVFKEQANGWSAFPFQGGCIPDNLVDAPYIFQDQANGWSALPFQGGYIPDHRSVDDMPPLVNHLHDAVEYEVDLLCSPTSTLNQNMPPSSASLTGSLGSPTSSKFNWHEKKPQRDRGTRRKAEAVYRKKRQDVDEEIRNFLRWRGIKIKSASKNALKLLDLCKDLATENFALRETCCQCTHAAL